MYKNVVYFFVGKNQILQSKELFFIKANWNFSGEDFPPDFFQGEFLTNLQFTNKASLAFTGNIRLGSKFER